MQDASWDNVTYEDTVPFIPPITSGKVVKVYDGDTLTIAGRLPGVPTLYRFSVRLSGIDCPEIRGKSPSEKEVALQAREFVMDRVMHAVVTLRHVTMEKYGRLLARVYYNDSFNGDEVCLNEELCKARLAVAYDGGTKVSPDDWQSYHDTN